MPDGNPYGVSLRYGRIEFVSAPGTVPTPDDVPIDPGETYVFKIPNYKVDGWEMWSAKEKIPPPKKVQVLLDYLSYGDDTGFDSPNGKPS